MEGRKREQRVSELRNVAGHKRGLRNWRGGRGRSGLVSFEMWQVTNEDSPPGGEEQGAGAFGGRKLVGPKKGPTDQRGGEGGHKRARIQTVGGPKQNTQILREER